MTRARASLGKGNKAKRLAVNGKKNKNRAVQYRDRGCTAPGPVPSKAGCSLRFTGRVFPAIHAVWWSAKMLLEQWRFGGGGGMSPKC